MQGKKKRHDVLTEEKEEGIFSRKKKEKTRKGRGGKGRIVLRGEGGSSLA